MASPRESLKHYVQLHVPTKDKDGRPLAEADVARWKERARDVFRRYVKGSYISPYFHIEDCDYQSEEGEWITEPNWIIKAYAPRRVCRQLLDALQRELVEEMRDALRQETIGIESSLEGFQLY